MSELKAYKFLGIDEVYSDANLGNEYYLKSAADKVIAHNKYKRCLAMARWCVSMMVFNSKYGTDRKWYLFKKWRDRWLTLAEEPTWAKFLQLIHKEAK